MALVRISVDGSQATIVADSLDQGSWAEIRRVVDLAGEDTRGVGASGVEMSLTTLLRSRQGLRLILGRLHRRGLISFSFDKGAIAALSDATNRQKRVAAPGLRLNATEVMRNLAERHFLRELKRYQADNVAQLATIPSGATFSVPGAGKTTEALALYWLLRVDTNRLFVVCPKNAFAVWEEQVGLCLPGQTVTRLRGDNDAIERSLASRPDVALINYELVPRAQRVIGAYFLSVGVFLFVDESHKIKGGGVMGTAVATLAPHAEYRLLLTGTPMPNSLDDLVPQFACLYPEINLDGQDIVSRFGGVFVRTTKSQLDLPKLRRRHIAVPLSPAQALLYQAMTKDFVEELRVLRPQDRLMFSKLGSSVMRLIQAVSNPALLIRSWLGGHPLLAAASAMPGPKVALACEIARHNARRGEKTIIWTSFIENVLYIAASLSDLNAQYIYGRVPTSEDDTDLDSREGKLRLFKEDSACFVLVANPAACAEAISLHRECHRAVFVDRTYNAAQFLQSEDRIHRLGATQPASSLILTSPGTIDDSIDRRLQMKIERMADFLNDRALNIFSYDIEDPESVGIDDDDIADIRLMLQSYAP